MNKKYTHIFFDLDNTLWNFEENSRCAMLESFQFFQLDHQVNFNLFFEVYSKHNHQLWENYRKKELSKKELIRKRFQNTFDELRLDGVDPEEMNSHYLDVMPKQKILNDGALEFLNHLKSKHYQMFIITNGFKEVQNRKLESSGLKPFFKKVFISEEIKTPKPGREIFEHAIKSTNAKKVTSIMIGDDWDGDVKGALNFGIDAVYYNNIDKCKLQAMENVVNNHNLLYKTGCFIALKDILP